MKKIVIVGPHGVGKTSMLITYAGNEFPTEYVPTVFDNYNTSVSYEGDEVDVTLWDTAGASDYDMLRPLSYPGTDVFLLCYDIGDPASLRECCSRFAEELATHAEGAPIILVGCKDDLRGGGAGGAVVSREEAEEVGKDLGCRECLVCSAMQGEGVVEVIQAAVRAAVAPQKEGKEYK